MCNNQFLLYLNEKIYAFSLVCNVVRVLLSNYLIPINVTEVDHFYFKFV